MAGLDWRAIDGARVEKEPFDHIVLEQVLEPACAAAIPDEFPVIRDSASFSLADAPPGPALSGLIDDLISARFRHRMEALFEVDLSERPTLVTLRGKCSPRDGAIHTDSKTKVLSLLLYLNADWPRRNGRLRLLRTDSSLENAAVEAPATMGSLVIFRRSDRSWQGHTPFSGQRRVLQLNYLQSARASMVGALRHRVSALVKQRVAG